MSVALAHRLDGPPGAPTVMLGNSLGTDWRMWEAVVALLADEFRLLRYDHRGQGASPVPPGPYRIAELGADAVGLIDAVREGPVLYAGVSLGGMVALWLGAHAPERLSGICVFNSSAHPGSPQAWRERAATVREAGSVAPVAATVAGRWLTPEFAAAHPELTDWLVATLSASPPDGYAALCELLAELDLRDDLAAIGVPALVVAGAQDGALGPEHSAVIAAGIPDARSELIDPAAHIPMLQRPEAVAALIRESLVST